MDATVRNQGVRKALFDLALMLVMGVLLALIGPFNTYNGAFAWRLVYWLGLCLGGYACYRPIAGAIVRAARSYDLPEPAAWIAAALIATIPMTAIVRGFAQLLAPQDPLTLEAAVSLYGHVLVIGGMVTALFWLLGRNQPGAPAASGPVIDPVAPDPAVQARFFDRIPARLGTDLLALEMEDHYLRVHTRLGSDLILLRMRDALAELDGIEGAQVHRSWWVARSAVDRVERDGRNLRLVLVGGLVAPVARNANAALKAAGWL